jgi:hypothetical protein
LKKKKNNEAEEEEEQGSSFKAHGTKLQLQSFILTR